MAQPKKISDLRETKIARALTVLLGIETGKASYLDDFVFDEITGHRIQFNRFDGETTSVISLAKNGNAHDARVLRNAADLLVAFNPKTVHLAEDEFTITLSYEPIKRQD